MNIVDYDSMGRRYQQGAVSSGNRIGSSAPSNVSSVNSIQRQNVSYVSDRKFTQPICIMIVLLTFTLLPEQFFSKTKYDCTTEFYGTDQN